jgi:cell division protein FtsB
MINRSYNLSAANRRQVNQPFWYRFFMSQRFLVVVFLLISIAICFPLVRSISKKRIVEKEIAEMKAENEAYANRSKELREVIDYLQSDASLEEQARLNLGLKKSNEAVVVVNRQTSKSTTTSVSEIEDRTTNWHRWINYFFK